MSKQLIGSPAGDQKAHIGALLSEDESKILWQQGVDLLYNKQQYLLALKNFELIAKADNPQLKIEAYFKKLEILPLIRLFKSAHQLIQELHQYLSSLSVSEEGQKLSSYHSRISEYKILLLALENFQQQKNPEIQEILDEDKGISASHRELIGFFLGDLSTPLSIEKRFSEWRIGRFLAKVASQNWIEHNNLCFWFGVLLSQYQCYAIAEEVFKKIRVIYLDSNHQIQVERSDKMSYLTYLQVLFNNAIRHHSDVFLNFMQASGQSEEYSNRSEVRLLRARWLFDHMEAINDNSISVYARLIPESLTLLKREFPKESCIKIFQLVTHKLENLFAYFDVQHYYHAFNEIEYKEELYSFIANGIGDYHLFYGDIQQAADLFSLAVSSRRQFSHREINCLLKKYAISFITESKDSEAEHKSRQGLKDLVNRQKAEPVEEKARQQFFSNIEIIAGSKKSSLCDESKLRGMVDQFTDQSMKPFFLKWVIILLYHQKKYEQSLSYIAKLHDQFKDSYSVEIILYQARCNAHLKNRVEFEKLLTDLSRKKRSQFNLKTIDIELVKKECEIHFFWGNLPELIQSYNDLKHLESQVTREYGIMDLPWINKLEKIVKDQVLTLLVKRITDSLAKHKAATSKKSSIFKRKEYNPQKWDEKLRRSLNLHFDKITQLLSEPLIEEIKKRLLAVYHQDLPFEKKETSSEIQKIITDCFQAQSDREVKQAPVAMDVMPIPSKIDQPLSKRYLFIKQLGESLEEGFGKARSYHYGFKPDKSVGIGEAAQLITMAGSLLPLGGKMKDACIGVSLFLHIGRKICDAWAQKQAQVMAERVLQLLPPGARFRHVSDLCDETAMMVAHVYGDQVDQLAVSDEGIPFFAQQVAVIMLWYIATDEGRNESLFNIKEEARQFFKTVLISLGIQRISPELERHSAAKMMTGLLFAPLLAKEDKRLQLATDDQKVNDKTPWTLEGILRRTSIEHSGVAYKQPGITQHQKYGSLQASSLVTLEWLSKQGFKPIPPGEEDSREDIEQSEVARCSMM